MVLATQLKLRYAGSCQASTPFHATVSYLQDGRPSQRSPILFMICLNVSVYLRNRWVEQINSLKNLDLCYGCLEKISLLLRFYSRLFVSLIITRHEILKSELP